MGQVSVTVNGRTYALSCPEGEEQRLLQLANFIESRANAVGQEFAPISDDRLLLLTAFVIADELLERSRPPLEVRSVAERVGTHPPAAPRVRPSVLPLPRSPAIK